MRTQLVALVVAVAMTGCATVAPPTKPEQPAAVGTVETPSLGWFSSLRVPAGHRPVLQYAARGAQVFRCDRREGGFGWVFRQPDAELIDAAGKPVGRHGANFSFEHEDGSRLLATIVANDEAPKPTDLRWLLLSTRSFGKGAFEGVSHVQRVNTRGGMPPAQCDAKDVGKVLRVDFGADFVFYRPQAD